MKKKGLILALILLFGISLHSETLTFENGAKYTGQVKNGTMHGKGTYTWSERYGSGVYTGQWKDDTMHGRGADVAHTGQYKGKKWTGARVNGEPVNGPEWLLWEIK